MLPAARQVFVDGVEQRLGGRAFDLLLALAAHADSVVSKETLYESVWRDCVVEPNNLQVQVWALRRLLGERAIATVPRRGYRLTVPVHRHAVDAGATASLEEAAGLRALVARARALLGQARWVTLVAPDAGVRRLALQSVARACAATTTWQWRGLDAAGIEPALWQRLNEAQALVLAPDLDEGAAHALQARVAALPAGLCVLASSAQPLHDTGGPWLDASALTALSPPPGRGASRGLVPRPSLARRPHDSAK